MRRASGQPRKADVISALGRRFRPEVEVGQRCASALAGFPTVRSGPCESGLCHIVYARGGAMSSLLLMTDAVEPSDHVLPALGLLSHQVRVSRPRPRPCLTPRTPT